MPEGESQFSRKICAIHLIFHMLKYGIGTAIQWRLMGSLKGIIFKNHHSLEQISRHPGQRSMIFRLTNRIQDASIFFFFFFFFFTAAAMERGWLIQTQTFLQSATLTVAILLSLVTHIYSKHGVEVVWLCVLGTNSSSSCCTDFWTRQGFGIRNRGMPQGIRAAMTYE